MIDHQYNPKSYLQIKKLSSKLVRKIAIPSLRSSKSAVFTLLFCAIAFEDLKTISSRDAFLMSSMISSTLGGSGGSPYSSNENLCGCAKK